MTQTLYTLIYIGRTSQPATPTLTMTFISFFKLKIAWHNVIKFQIGNLNFLNCIFWGASNDLPGRSGAWRAQWKSHWQKKRLGGNKWTFPLRDKSELRISLLWDEVTWRSNFSKGNPRWVRPAWTAALRGTDKEYVLKRFVECTLNHNFFYEVAQCVHSEQTSDFSLCSEADKL